MMIAKIKYLNTTLNLRFSCSNPILSETPDMSAVRALEPLSDDLRRNFEGQRFERLDHGPSRAMCCGKASSPTQEPLALLPYVAMPKGSAAAEGRRASNRYDLSASEATPAFVCTAPICDSASPDIAECPDFMQQPRAMLKGRGSIALEMHGGGHRAERAISPFAAVNVREEAERAAAAEQLRASSGCSVRDRQKAAAPQQLLASQERMAVRARYLASNFHAAVADTSVHERISSPDIGASPFSAPAHALAQASQAGATDALVLAANQHPAQLSPATSNLPTLHQSHSPRMGAPQAPEYGYHLSGAGADAFQAAERGRELMDTLLCMQRGHQDLSLDSLPMLHTAAALQSSRPDQLCYGSFEYHQPRHFVPREPAAVDRFGSLQSKAPDNAAGGNAITTGDALELSGASNAVPADSAIPSAESNSVYTDPGWRFSDCYDGVASLAVGEDVCHVIGFEATGAEDDNENDNSSILSSLKQQLAGFRTTQGPADKPNNRGKSSRTVSKPAARGKAAVSLRDAKANGSSRGVSSTNITHSPSPTTFSHSPSPTNFRHTPSPAISRPARHVQLAADLARDLTKCNSKSQLEGKLSGAYGSFAMTRHRRASDPFGSNIPSAASQHRLVTGRRHTISTVEKAGETAAAEQSKRLEGDRPSHVNQPADSDANPVNPNAGATPNMNSVTDDVPREQRVADVTCISPFENHARTHDWAVDPRQLKQEGGGVRKSDATFSRGLALFPFRGTLLNDIVYVPDTRTVHVPLPDTPVVAEVAASPLDGIHEGDVSKWIGSADVAPPGQQHGVAEENDGDDGQQPETMLKLPAIQPQEQNSRLVQSQV